MNSFKQLIHSTDPVVLTKPSPLTTEEKVDSRFGCQTENGSEWQKRVSIPHSVSVYQQNIKKMRGFVEIVFTNKRKKFGGRPTNTHADLAVVARVLHVSARPCRLCSSSSLLYNGLNKSTPMISSIFVDFRTGGRLLELFSDWWGINISVELIRFEL